MPVNGNVVITDPTLTVNGWTAAGAVYLFNGQNGQLIRELVGSAPNMAVGGGGVGVCTNGNYVVFSNYSAVDASHAGFCATFVNGTTGLTIGDVNSGSSGGSVPTSVVTGANSLIQNTTVSSGAQVECLTSVQNTIKQSACEVLLGGLVNIDPTTSALNAAGSRFSLGTPPLENQIFTFIPLPNGNYLVLSAQSNALTFGNGTNGVAGVISSTNSLIGSAQDVLGASQVLLTPQALLSQVTVFPDSTYAVTSTHTDTVTFGSGNSGATGNIPLAGSVAGGLISPLTNGNLAVADPVHGTASLVARGTFHVISTLTGGGAGLTVTPLSNGNFVVCSPAFNDGAGAFTLVNGTAGLNTAVSAANSMVGSSEGDDVGSGGAIALSNGNYVVFSPNFHGERGAATFGSGTVTAVGTVTAANSLVGVNVKDAVGSNGGTALTNGNYVVISPLFGDGEGAVTFGNGASGTVGTVSTANSLLGANDTDAVGSGGAVALAHGGFVALSPSFGSGKGAATYGNGTSLVAGTVSSANSLVGTTTSDNVGISGAVALANGNYVVVSPNFGANSGAVTFGNGTSGVRGVVTSSNSLVGNAGDSVGGGTMTLQNANFQYPVTTAQGLNTNTMFGVVPLPNGNYVVMTPGFGGGAGAATFGNGSTGVVGGVTATNSLVGSVATDHVSGGGVVVLPSGNYVVLSPFWSNGSATLVGAATFGLGTTGISGQVSPGNSLVGVFSGDLIGYTSENTSSAPNIYQTLFNQGGTNGNSVGQLSQFGIPSVSQNGQITILSTGDYVVMSPWAFGETGAATLCSGSTGLSGPLTTTNSLVGQTGRGLLGMQVGFNGTHLVAGGEPALAQNPVIVVSQ